MFNFKKTKRQTPGVKELQKQVKEAEERLAKTEKELAVLKEGLLKAVTKVGIVRYNPFGEIGGDQSFSVALLNEHNTGVVITSHYGKDLNRVYAKPVAKGKSEYALSTEEEQAMKKAEKH